MFNRLARPLIQSNANSILINKLVPSLPRYFKNLDGGHAQFATKASLEYFQRFEDEANKAALKVRDESPVGQFGWLPFWGFVSTILISKELVPGGPEFMLLTTFGVTVFLVYAGLSENFAAAVREELAEKKDMFDRATDYHIERMRVYKAQTQIGVDSVPVLEQMLQQQREVQRSFIAAQNLEERHALQKAFLEKLTAIKTREDAEAALARSMLIDEAVKNVIAAFAEDEGPLRSEALLNAISLMGTDGSTTLEQDPVKKLFVKELQ